MISIEQIKQLIIQRETEWIEGIHDDQDIPIYVNGMTDDVNECKDIDDLVGFYLNSGYNLQEAYENIISILRENAQVKE